MNLEGQFDAHLETAHIIQGQQFERCGNCDCEFPEGTGSLVEVHTSRGTEVMNVCPECSQPRQLYFTESEWSEHLRYSATVYEQNEMIIGFGPTEPAAVADLREKYIKRFDRDLITFERS